MVYPASQDATCCSLIQNILLCTLLDFGALLYPHWQIMHLGASNSMT